MNPRNTLNAQILSLHNKGLTPDQIAGALDLPGEVVEASLRTLTSDGRRKKSLEERYGDVEDIVMTTLIQVAENSENDSARVRSAELLKDILEGNKELKKSELNPEAIAEALIKVRGRLVEGGARLRLENPDTKLIPSETGI